MERKKARRFVKVSEEIVAINEAAIFYPSDLVNTKTTIPLRVGEERWIYIYPPLFTSTSGDSCIIYNSLHISYHFMYFNI